MAVVIFYLLMVLLTPLDFSLLWFIIAILFWLWTD